MKFSFFLLDWSPSLLFKQENPLPCKVLEPNIFGCATKTDFHNYSLSLDNIILQNRHGRRKIVGDESYAGQDDLVPNSLSALRFRFLLIPDNQQLVDFIFCLQFTGGTMGIGRRLIAGSMV